MTPERKTHRIDSREVTQRFIEDYKALELLWNTDLKNYYMKHLRDAALQRLSKKYRITIKNVKNKIKNIRSYFCKEHHKCLRKIESGDKNYESTWFAYKQLLFLAGITQTLPANIETTDENAEVFNSMEVALKPDPDNFEYVSCNTDIDEKIDTASTSSETPDTNNKKRKWSHSDYEIKENESNDTTKITDECSVFGDLVAHKIRNLSSARQRAIAQNRISNMLFAMEMSDEKHAFTKKS